MHDYSSRRKALFAKMESASVALVFGARKYKRNADTEWLFRQSSDMLYLTGFNEPNCCLVLTKEYDGTCKSTFFLMPKDPLAECWDGRRCGVDACTSSLGVDEAYPISDLDKHLFSLCSNKQYLYHNFSANMKNDISVIRTVEKVKEGMRRGGQAPDTMRDLSTILHELRLFKDQSEISLMREVAKISAEAHNIIMKRTKPGLYEYQLEASFTYHCQDNGCVGLAYPAIVASGSNACILHYTENRDEIKDGDLLLVDAGGELNGYAADITRTIPINGKFSSEQAKVYNLVLSAQLAGIDSVKVGASVDSVQKSILDVIVPGLIELGLLHGDKDKIIESQEYKKFYMHGSGHWLGLDVHDAGNYRVGSEWRAFESNMVVTVEPGIYIPSTDEIPESYRGIGIRIEDDILVTDHGPEVLSAATPKSIGDIEALMANSQ